MSLRSLSPGDVVILDPGWDNMTLWSRADFIEENTEPCGRMKAGDFGIVVAVVKNSSVPWFKETTKHIDGKRWSRLFVMSRDTMGWIRSDIVIKIY